VAGDSGSGSWGSGLITGWLEKDSGKVCSMVDEGGGKNELLKCGGKKKPWG